MAISPSGVSGDPAYSRFQAILKSNRVSPDRLGPLMARLCPRTDSAPFARGDITYTPDTEARRRTSLIALALGICSKETPKEEDDARSLIHTSYHFFLEYPARIAVGKGNQFFLDACETHPAMTKSQKLALFAVARDFPRVMALLEYDSIPSSFSKKAVGETLKSAAAAGHLAIATLLLNRVGIGEDENLISRKDAGLALNCAVEMNRHETLALLLNRIGIGDGENQIPRESVGAAMRMAAEINHLDALSLFLNRIDIGKEPHQISRVDVGWALIKAAQYNHTRALTLLLNEIDIGEEPHQIPKDYAESAFTAAATQNHPDALALILDRIKIGKEPSQISREIAGFALRTADDLPIITLLLVRIGIGDGENQISREDASMATHTAQDHGHIATALAIQKHTPSCCSLM